jgi:hypothetical protein
LASSDMYMAIGQVQEYSAVCSGTDYTGVLLYALKT